MVNWNRLVVLGALDWCEGRASMILPMGRLWDLLTSSIKLFLSFFSMTSRNLFWPTKTNYHNHLTTGLHLIRYWDDYEMARRRRWTGALWYRQGHHHPLRLFLAQLHARRS